MTLAEYNITSLSEISFEQLFETHSMAFKNYPFQWTKDSFLKMLHRRGFNQELSFGAFEKNQLVSFTLNGIGSFSGIKTAYDTSTGTMEAHRGKGLASKIFEHSIPFLKIAGVRQYILEVLEENEKALSVYLKQGFTISRKFDCFKVNTDDWKFTVAGSNQVELKEIDFSYQTQLEAMIDFHLSWQNNFQALLKKPNNFRTIGAFHQNNLLGYGIIEPGTGDIPVLAVDRKFRRKRIGTMLLNELKKINCASIAKAVNIESNQDAIISFLTKNGMPKIVSQFEMIKLL